MKNIFDKSIWFIMDDRLMKAIGYNCMADYNYQEFCGQFHCDNKFTNHNRDYEQISKLVKL